MYDCSLDTWKRLLGTGRQGNARVEMCDTGVAERELEPVGQAV